MKSASRLLLLALPAVAHCTTAVPSVTEGYQAQHSVNIATVISLADDQEYANLASYFDDRLDLVLLGNESITSLWLDTVGGYASVADDKIMYQTASWSLIEDGAEEDVLASYWARFETFNYTATSMSVCAMVLKWDNSWKENIAALSAIDVMNRLKAKCGENDTIAVAFTSAVSETVEKFLMGEITVNGAIAPFSMRNVHNSIFPEASDRMFYRLAGGFCPRDEFTEALASLTNGDAPLISLIRGETCAPNLGPKDPQASNEESGHNDSDWKRDLRFIIPVGVCIFVLGCAGLVYLYRRKKKDAFKTDETAADTPKAEEKEVHSSLPYELSVHPV